MVSRKYKSLKILYKDDFNIEKIKVQRAYLYNDLTFITPITSTFLNSLVNSNIKATNTNVRQLRIAETIVFDENNNNTTQRVIIPNNNYRQDLIAQQIKEILELPKVNCIKFYRGEIKINE